MPLLETDETVLHYELHGTGEPTTVFAHGVASSIEDIRFLASGVRGTRVFFHFRGHGPSGTPEEQPGLWGYPSAARDLRAVADHVEARRCLGVSLGAGAMLALLVETPDRFDRAVFVLPAGLDTLRPADPESDLAQTARLIDLGDLERLTAHLTAALPPDVAARRGVDRIMRERAERLCGSGVARAIRALPSYAPIADRAALATVTCRSLVIAHEGDETHPAAVARELAAALPAAALHVFDRPWSMLRERATLRAVVAGFLGAAG